MRVADIDGAARGAARAVRVPVLRRAATHRAAEAEQPPPLTAGADRGTVPSWRELVARSSGGLCKVAAGAHTARRTPPAGRSAANDALELSNARTVPHWRESSSLARSQLSYGVRRHKHPLR